MGRFINRLRGFAEDQRGNIAILSAVFAMTIMALAALGVDTGKVFIDRRKAQGATDLAALAAVNDLASAAKAAAATAKRNSFGDEATVTVELGIYTGSRAVSPAIRFQPASASSANAARVTLQTSSSLTFGAALIGRNTFDVKTQAIAAQSAFVNFAIGSQLASLNGGLMNNILGALLGTNISLSAMDYDALLKANLDMFDFMNTLATRVHVTGGQYDALLSSNVKVADIVGAMIDTGRAASGNSAAVGALNSVALALGGSTSKVLLRSILDAGPYDTMTVGQKPKVSATASMLDLLTASAQLANGQRQVQAAVNLGVPGIAGAALALAIGERPQGESWITVGPVGASVHTAQTRVLLTATVSGLGAIANVTLPIYLELAAASAKLSNVKCGFPDGGMSTATLSVKPALVDAWIGEVSMADFQNFTSAPNPPAAALVSTPLLTVTGRSHVAVTNMAATPVTFSMSDISAKTRKSVGTSNFSGSLISNLVGGTQLGVTVLGGLSLPGPTLTLVGTILEAAAAPVDQLLSEVLRILGVGLGRADVWVNGLRCDGAVLVN